MPQASSCDAEAPPLLLPLEALEEALEQLGRHTGYVLNASGLSSSHYVSRSTGASPTAAQLRHREATRQVAVDGATRRSVCCLYRHDVALYRAMCAQRWLLEGCEGCVEACREHLAQCPESPGERGSRR